MNIDWLESNIIFECISGSHAYGLNTPESDIDYRGVCIAPEDYYFGLYEFDQHEQKDPDRVIYNIKKFANLALQNNPNILEVFFMPEDCIIKTTPEWEMLASCRQAFLSKKVKHTYTGYAYAQLKRCMSHKSWLLHPVDHKPERSEFGIEDNGMSRSDYGMLQSLEDKDQLGTLSNKEIINLYIKEKNFRNALKQYNQYQEWKQNRNPKRAALEAAFGYDSKHLGHVFRLLIQGEHILREGTLQTRLNDEDRKYIMEIKSGKYSYEELIATADNKMADFETYYNESKLPHSPDMATVNDTLKKVFHYHYKNLPYRDR